MAVNFVSCNTQRELISSISRNHMKYLQEDKSSSEIRYRRALEDDIRVFINYEHHLNKFAFPSTAEILRRNVQSEHFNALKAAEAWSALSIYAKNLLNQPWRSEFHEIKLYSGFYKHKVESHLNDAEIMLKLMGYKRVGNRLALEKLMAKDLLCEVSLDTLKAMCECQVLFSIYEELSKYISNITYADILEYREANPGSVDLTIRGILDRTSAYCCADYRFDSSVRGYHSSYRSDIRDYQQSYTPSTNGYVMNARCEPQYQFSNGHCDCVRTAKLIDLDDASEHDTRWTRQNRKLFTDPLVSSEREQRPRFPDLSLSDSSNSVYADKISRKEETRKCDALWDYLSKQSDKENAKNKPNYQVSSSQSRSHLRSNGVSEALNNISLRPDEDRNDNSRDAVDGHKQSTKKLNFLELKKVNNTAKKGDRSQTWTCTICTFYNAKSKEVCEMCGKSKNVAEEAPLESGGKHCTRCTLVNKKEAQKCEACDGDLENSPTYV